MFTIPNAEKNNSMLKYLGKKSMDGLLKFRYYLYLLNTKVQITWWDDREQCCVIHIMKHPKNCIIPHVFQMLSLG